MKFATQFKRQVRQNGELQREEETDVVIEFSEHEVDLKIDHEVRGPGESDREATTVHASAVDIQDIKVIRDQLTEWCLETDSDPCHIDTGFIEGECIQGGASQEFGRLRVRIDQQGVHFTSVDDDLPIGTAVIPACRITDENEPNDAEHHYEFDLLLRTALHCVEGDILINANRIDVAGEFSGPLHRDLQDNCLGLYFEGSGTRAASVAGQTLDQRIRELADPPPGKSTRNLVGELFDNDPPRIEFSTYSSENQGVQFLIQGALMALRNPLTHREPSPDGERFLDSFTQRYARDILYFYDLLFLLFENELNINEE